MGAYRTGRTRILTVSPYFHFNDTHYVGGPGDMPTILNENSHSDYLGVRAVVQGNRKHHDARIGFESLGAAQRHAIRT